MHVFLSYSHEDAQFVDRLARDLMHNKARVWIDRWQLSVGDSLIERIEKAVEDAYAVIIVLSRAATRSKWCRTELSSALLKELEQKRVFVLPVVIDRCKVPLFLRGKLYADFREDYDTGISNLLRALAPYISTSRDRAKIKGLHNDWGCFHVDTNDRVSLQIMSVIHSQRDAFSIYTEFTVLLNSVAGDLFRRFEQAGLTASATKQVVAFICRLRDRPELNVSLGGGLPSFKEFGVADANSGATYDLRIMSMLLGRDPGAPVFLDFAEVLGQVHESLESRTSHLQEDEQRVRDLIPR